MPTIDVFRVSFQNFEVEELPPGVCEDVFLECDFDHFKCFTTETQPASRAFFDFTNNFLYQTRHVNAMHVKKFQVFLRSGATNEVLGTASIDLRTLACGPRNYILPFNEGGDVKFEIIMHHELDVEIHVADLTVSNVRSHSKVILGYQFSYLASPGELFKTRKAERSKRNTFTFPAPPYIHHNASLKDLFHANIKFQLLEPKRFGHGNVIAEGQLPCVEHLSMNPNQSVPFECSLLHGGSRVADVSGTLQFINVPRFTPMQGGFYTPDGLHGARPLLAQVEFPNMRTGMGPPFSLLKSSQARGQRRGAGNFLADGTASPRVGAGANPFDGGAAAGASGAGASAVGTPALGALAATSSGLGAPPENAPAQLSGLPLAANTFVLPRRQFNNPYQQPSMNMPDPSTQFGSEPPPVLPSDSTMSMGSVAGDAGAFLAGGGRLGPSPSSSSSSLTSQQEELLQRKALEEEEAQRVEKERQDQQAAADAQAAESAEKQQANFLAGGRRQEEDQEEEPALPPSYDALQSEAPPGYAELFAAENTTVESSEVVEEEEPEVNWKERIAIRDDHDGANVARNEGDGSFTIFCGGAPGAAQQELTLQATEPLPLDNGIRYFECFIEYGENDATIVIGFGAQGYPSHTRVGESPNSFGYNGSDGYIALEGKRRNFGTLFGPGDVVGLGYKQDTKELFCSRNGEFLGTCFQGVPELCFVPTITMLGSNIQVKCNLGAGSFAFDPSTVRMPSTFSMMQDSLRRPYFVDHNRRTTTWNDPRTNFPSWRYLVDQNDFLVDKLKQEGRFYRPKVGQALRLVPRGAFLPEGVDDEAYQDKMISLNHPCLEVLPPWLLAFVMEQLCLGDCLGWRVLCVGSGCGHFSTMAGLLVGESGLSHGVDIDHGIVDFSRRCLEDYTVQTGRYIANVSFIVRNMLLPKSQKDTARYDRIFVTGGISEIFLPTLMEYLDEDGVMIVCVEGQLERIVRHPNKVERNVLVALNLPGLQEPSEEDFANFENGAFWEQLVEMGYSPDSATYAVDKYGTNREKVFAFLSAFKSMLDLGYPPDDCAEALYIKDNKLEEAANYLVTGE